MENNNNPSPIAPRNPINQTNDSSTPQNTVNQPAQQNQPSPQVTSLPTLDSAPVISNEPTEVGGPLILNAPESYQETKQDVRKKEDRHLYKLTGFILGFFLLLWICGTFVVGLTTVNGISMRPTFQTGNVVLILKLPVTWQKLTGIGFIPARGAVVIVKDTTNNGEQFIKRVIAQPYEHVNVTNGVVKVTKQNGNIIYPDNAPYGKNLPFTDGAYDGTVGSGQIFAMGDNRTSGASIDSRSSMGAIPDNYVIGQVVLRIWPLSKISLF
jgi:signal peptidase I